MTRERREAGVVLLVSTALSAVMLDPLVRHIASVGRVDNGDGRFSIWNVAWVARTLVADPLHVFDANIFYPHRWTLVYSESNLGAGALAVPAYWATRNPYIAHNFAVLLGFILSATGMYYLVRYLTGDRRAAAVSSICFAFCPYIFARMAEIQLLMTAGLPFSMLAFQRLADRPTIRRGAVLGLALAAQAFFCGYYAIFVMLMVGFAVLLIAWTRGLWADPRYWLAIAAGAVVALIAVAPVLLPYVMVQRVTGFHRPLTAAVGFSANWPAYLASSSYAHVWMLEHLPSASEVLFPGFVATILGAVGAWFGWQGRSRELVFLYGGFAILAFWASFGPAADLYAILYDFIPGFAWLRAPARFGLVVVFGLCVLTGSAVATLLPRFRRPTLIGVALAIVATSELVVPLNMRVVSPVGAAYRMLATLPRGPIIEMPFFWPEVGLFRHADYMLDSTAHWMPLINGYSDYIPPEFVANALTLAQFPSRDAFRLLEPKKVRYALFHRPAYNFANWTDAIGRAEESAPCLRPLYVDETVRLYEITGYPPHTCAGPSK